MMGKGRWRIALPAMGRVALRGRRHGRSGGDIPDDILWRRYGLPLTSALVGTILRGHCRTMLTLTCHRLGQTTW